MYVNMKCIEMHIHAHSNCYLGPTEVFFIMSPEISDCIFVTRTEARQNHQWQFPEVQLLQIVVAESVGEWSDLTPAKNMHKLEGSQTSLKDTEGQFSKVALQCEVSNKKVGWSKPAERIDSSKVGSELNAPALAAAAGPGGAGGAGGPAGSARRPQLKKGMATAPGALEIDSCWKVTHSMAKK